jgi:nucleotide-binding universal stress UspA family protein
VAALISCVIDLIEEASVVTMKRFLAATDGSRDGEHAAAMACTLAERAGGEFARLEVESAAPTWEPQLEWWREATTRNGTANRLRGLPGIEIVRHAEAWRADVVVLGRHDRTALGPFTLGETSDAVIRRRSGLSLFAPPETHSFTRALVALDGSDRGLGVLGSAAAFLDIAEARAHVICVLPDSAIEVTEVSSWHEPKIERVRALVNRLRLSSGLCDLLVRRGDPVRKVLEAIQSTSADLLVLGVRRGGAAGDLGSGHVGRDLLQAAPCAVLTVPI